jgi:hypothetical protein
MSDKSRVIDIPSSLTRRLHPDFTQEVAPNDGEGTVGVSYNRLAYLQERHGVPTELLAISP